MKKKIKYQRKWFLKIFLLLFVLWILLSFFWTILFIYIQYIQPLPPITQLEEIEIKKASVIYDRKGNELYTFFNEEKRTYVPYSNISKNMIHAIVAGEDKKFFENKGWDIPRIIAAIINYVTGKTEKIEGTSTISQQLIRNLFLHSERKIGRKIQEIYLSYMLNKTYTKEKILELYLNKIWFWSNAYGVEQASLTFFWKSIRDVSILEAAILASLPKGPSYYSPYNHYDRLMGTLLVYDTQNPQEKIFLTNKQKIQEYKEMVDEFITFFSKTHIKPIDENTLLLCGIDKNFFKKHISINNQNCTSLNYSELLSFLNAIRIEKNNTIIEYQTGRKDFILGRMLEDGYISWEEYKQAFIEAIGFSFKTRKEKIKHPHFVMYIKEYLKEKYWEKIIEEWGLKIYTTLDPNLQKKAEEIIKKQVEINKKKYNANNAALIAIDNSQGDILAFVGWVNYFNEEIQGNVNMVTSKRQPGSSFKPYVYALAIEKNPFCSETPIYDLPTNFWKYRPKNYDGTFLGKMTLSTALNHSRNIPAVKLYYLAWQNQGIAEFLQKIGIQFPKNIQNYGASLALGTMETSPLEMVQWYSIFPNNGKLIPINPIVKIVDSRWILVEQKPKRIEKKQILSEETAYIMATILSKSEDRPNAFWNKNLTLKNRIAWAKTGTSNKVIVSKWKKRLLPGDLWTVGFTRQITTAVWVGNTDGAPLHPSADGLNGAAPIWKEFMEYAHSGKSNLSWEKPKAIQGATISKISWLLASDTTPQNQKTYCYFKNLPKEYDTSLKEIQIDIFCNGKVTENTPSGAIKTVYYVLLRDIDPKNTYWNETVKEWAKNGWAKKLFWRDDIITEYNEKECNRNPELLEKANIDLKTNIEDKAIFTKLGTNPIFIEYTSNNPLRSIEILIDETSIAEIDINNEKTWKIEKEISLPSTIPSGNHILTIRAIDSIYYTKEAIKQIYIEEKDTTIPTITIQNPADNDIALYEWQFFNLRATIEEKSPLRSVNLYLNGAPYKLNFSKEKNIVISINENNDIPLGTHTLTIEAVDWYFNIGKKDITLTILQR